MNTVFVDKGEKAINEAKIVSSTNSAGATRTCKNMNLDNRNIFSKTNSNRL